MGPSLSRIAEDLVRAGDGQSARWQGLTLVSHLQPIYSVRKAGCIGFEALVRATGDDGPVRPEALFERAREDGDGVLLDWICRVLHLRRFAAIDCGDRRLFLNVHPEAAVRDARSVRELAGLVRYYGLAPARMTLELLEAPCAEEAMLREAVAAYRALGVGVAMEGFGHGRSNFDRVAALRPDVVKVDRSILARSVGESKSRRMLPAIVALLREAGTQVAVEGVESAHEALIAIDAGADLLQGLHLAAPSARPADGEALAEGLFAELLRMRGPPRPAAVGIG